MRAEDQMPRTHRPWKRNVVSENYPDMREKVGKMSIILGNELGCWLEYKPIKHRG